MQTATITRSVYRCARCNRDLLPSDLRHGYPCGCGEFECYRATESIDIARDDFEPTPEEARRLLALRDGEEATIRGGTWLCLDSFEDDGSREWKYSPDVSHPDTDCAFYAEEEIHEFAGLLH